MKLIALSILSVGLCFYVAYRYKATGSYDSVASLIALISTLMIIFGK